MSPMRRTIETAFHIFKDHPNFKNMKFKVNPLIREKILIGGDYPVFNSFKTIKEEYQPLFESHGSSIEIDEAVFSPSQDDATKPWYFKALDEGLKQRVVDGYGEASKDEAGFNLVLTEALEDGFP